jgi:hypothetical protein
MGFPMKIDVKVYGQIQKVTQTEYAVQVNGSIDTVSLGTKYCDKENVFFFQQPYSGVLIEGSDLKVKDFGNGKVLVKGIIFTLKFLNKEGEVVKRYNVETCCIRVTEVPEEEPDEEEDEDLLDELD